MKLILKKIFNLKVFLVLFLLIGGYSTFRFASVYIVWKNKKDDVLKKLSNYKKQIDFLKQPITSSGTGSFRLGPVAIPSRVYDKNNKIIGEFLTQRRKLIPLDKMPKYVPKILIISEDKEFYNHNGINYSAIFRAFLKNIISFSIQQGGSTITQQLAKVLFTQQQRSLDRKIFEFFAAKEIEEHYTKKEILEMYLNLVYFGHRNYGIDSACLYFFGKSIKKASMAEVALLVGTLPGPNLYSPIKHLQNSLRRQHLVLRSMVKDKLITKKQKNRFIKKFNKTWQVKTKEETSKIGKFVDRFYRLNLAPFYLNHIKQKLLKHFTINEITKGGLKIYTSLDYRRQRIAKKLMTKAIDKQLAYYQKKINYYQKKNTSAKIRKKIEKFEKKKEGLNGAFISIEVKSGYILSMIGGKSFSADNQFNRALYAKRQIGSLIKALIYYLAIRDKVITPASLIDDSRLKIGKKKYHNYDYKYLGKITARDALRKSRNIPSLKLLQKIGVDSLREVVSEILEIPFAKVEKIIPNEIVVALGTISLTPIQIAKIYAVFANQGKSVFVRDLLRIENKSKETLWEAETPSVEKQILDSDAAYITVTMLQSVFEKGGTVGWLARLQKKDPPYIPFEIAGKTGTTSGYKDAWFAGFTSYEANSIWIGNDDNSSLGQGRAGGALASPIWVSYMKAISAFDKPTNFLDQWDLKNVTRESFCNESGGVPHSETSCPHTIHKQVFLKGTEPKFYCDKHLLKKEKEDDTDEL